MKKLLTLLALVGLGLTAKAATHSYTFGAWGPSNVVFFTQGVALHAITINNPTNEILVVKFIDSATTSHTNYVPAYTNYSTMLTNYTNTVVASSGVTNSYIYTNVIRMVTNAVAGAWQNNTVVGEFTVPASETLYVPLSSPLNTYLGLCVTNSGRATVLLNYSPQK